MEDKDLYRYYVSEYINRNVLSHTNDTKLILLCKNIKNELFVSDDIDIFNMAVMDNDYNINSKEYKLLFSLIDMCGWCMDILYNKSVSDRFINKSR